MTQRRRGGSRRRAAAQRQAPAEPLELTLYGFTHGGEAVGRRPDGKVCFVPHAIPGERVRVAIETERRSWSRGRLLDVMEPSADRMEPPCPYARPGACGGCALQHIRPARQAELLRQVVIDQLERIGHLHAPPVEQTRRPHAGDRHPSDLGYRTRARFSVDDAGRLGFHREGTHEVIPIDHCRLLTAAAHGARVEAGDRWGGAQSVAVSAGDDGTGLIEITPGSGALPDIPSGERAVVLVDELGDAHTLRPAGNQRSVNMQTSDDGVAAVHHEVRPSGTEPGTFRVSATSFFQPSTEAAAVLVEEVLRGARVTAGDSMLDVYSGVGLFTRFLAEAGAAVTALESHPAAVRDARHNLAGLDVDVVECDAHRGVRQRVADGSGVDAVVLDPPRQGAGAQLVTDLAELRPSRVVYVACDPAALARDARVLVDLGYRLLRVVPVDQFTHTGHIEAVATFHRA